MSLEICVHCVGNFYSRLLSYQLTSLMHQDGVKVSVITDEDSSRGSAFDVCNFFAQDVNVVCHQLPNNQAMRRAIGRNLIARHTTSQWVWFADADYLFFRSTREIIASLAKVPDNVNLVYQQTVFATKTHAIGEAMIKRIDPPYLAYTNAGDEFTPNRMRFAIGGIQICRGSYAREHGYLDNSKWQQPPKVGEWQETREDVAFRKSVPGPHLAIDIPGIYRIRHRRAKDWWPIKES